LLDLARFCQESHIRAGGAAPCPTDSPPHPPAPEPAPSAQPRWQDLPTNHQEELLRRLGRMLAERLAVPDVTAEGTHEPH